MASHQGARRLRTKMLGASLASEEPSESGAHLDAEIKIAEGVRVVPVAEKSKLGAELAKNRFVVSVED